MQIQITFKDMPHSTAVEQHIREKAAKLAHFHPHILDCQVSVEMPHKHQHQGRLHNLRIELRVPGGEIVVNRDRDENLYVAISDAFDSANRQLAEYDQRQRREVKHHETRASPPMKEGDES